MRLGLLGPARNREAALDRAARFLRQDIAVDRAIYLGVDTAIDTVIRRWAEELVGGDPDDGALWGRAAERCIHASHEQIDAFLEAERERRCLKVFQSLPGDGTRVIEILNGKVAVMIYDKADLDEEDILPASLLVFGKSQTPLVKQVGSRWFLSPGSFPDAGIMTLEDHEDGIHLTLFDGAGHEQSRQLLLASRGTKLKVTSDQ
ncbi:MAG TPA: hypothetical protein VK524_08190 [Polyangiaceae bacterium]|nr:hypothetical protein [Polyangiaceae bacterium]